MRVCIVGASGKLGQYMVQHALDRGYEVVGVCREQSVEKLGAFKERITVVSGATDDRDVIEQAVAGCDGVLVVLVPRGVHGYSAGTAQAVLDHAQPGARLVFSSGWHITRHSACTLVGCENMLFPTATGGLPGTGSGPRGIADMLAPAFRGRVRAVPARFRVQRRTEIGVAIGSAAKGTSFRYVLSEAATVSFAIKRKARGHRVDGTCRPSTRSHANTRRCTLWRRIGALRARAMAGANRKRFFGRLDQTTLKPGSYRALLVAVDTAGNPSKTARAHFKVLPPKPGNPPSETRS
jgi:hypothetical protein